VEEMGNYSTESSNEIMVDGFSNYLTGKICRLE
jgi:hypothetical protein